MKPMIDQSRFTQSLLAQSLRALRQWRLLLLWTGAMLIPTALLALPAWRLLAGQLDHSVHAAALAQRLDLVAIADLWAVYSRHEALFDYATLVALGVTLLLSPALCAMALVAARAERAPGFAELIAGAAADYPRMLRMLLWAAVPLGAAASAGAALVNLAQVQELHAVTASGNRLLQGLAGGVLLLLLLLAHASIDAGRAVLALEQRRTSAIGGWVSGCRLLAVRPIATLGAYAAISIGGLGVAALLAMARLHLPGGGMVAFIGAVLLTQVIVLVIGATRVARLFALVALARSGAVKPMEVAA